MTPGTDPVWLVDVVVSGVVYRYSDEDVEVTGRAGTYHYPGGLVDQLAISLRGGSASLTIGPDVDWSALVAQGAILELGIVVVRRWWPGQILEEARVVLRGRITSASYGERGEPLTIQADPEYLAGVQGSLIPPASAQVVSESTASDEEGAAVTWPVSGALYFALNSALGRHYPWVIGRPGDAGAGMIPWDAVPAPSAEGAPASSQLWLIIAGHPVEATQVRIKDAEDPRPFAGAWGTVAQIADGYGRIVSYVDAVAAGLSVAMEQTYSVGYSASYGGGLVGTDGRLIRGLGQIIDWVHREWVPTPALDRGRQAAWSAQLDSYQIDTWIDEPIDALEWLDSLISVLPIDRVDGPDGYYWRPRVTLPDARLSRIHLDADAGSVTRQSLISRDASTGVANEIVVEYACARNSTRKTRSITSESGKLSDTPTWFGWLDDTERVLPSIYAARSRSMYGTRQARVEYPTYDDTTALRIAEQILLDSAVPHRRVTYRGGYSLEGLEPGDVVTLTDTAASLAAVVCRVDDVILSGPVVDLVLVVLSEPAMGEGRA